MAESRFVYVIYIRTTPEKLWQALIEPEFTRQFWYETWQDCQWTEGASWKIVRTDGVVANTGEVLEIDPTRKLVLSWRKEFVPELAAEGHTRLTYELEPQEGMVKLTVTHESDKPHSKTIAAVASGWPPILSSLKSLLETGEPLDETRRWPESVSVGK